MRLSTGLINKLTDTYSLRDALAGFVLDVYAGVQPTLPDISASGSKLVVVTDNSGAYTPETASVGSITVTGTSGSFTAVTVNTIDILGGTVAYAVGIPETATALALQINRNPKNHLFTASTTGSSGVVTLTSVNGLGTLPNTWVVASTGTCTATYGNMASGVNSVNGLFWDMAVGGVISKIASTTWSGVALVSGTAGWFRIRGGADDGTGTSTTAVRIDGTISTSGADMNLGSLVLTAAAPFLVPTAAITLPQQ